MMAMTAGFCWNLAQANYDYEKRTSRELKFVSALSKELTGSTKE